MEVQEAILPSGKAVRFELMNTRRYLEINKRAAKRADRGDMTPEDAFAHEAILTLLRGYTPQQPWKYRPLCKQVCSTPSGTSSYCQLAEGHDGKHVPVRLGADDRPVLEPELPHEMREIDALAMLDEVPVTEWRPVAYEGLITVGVTELAELFPAPVEYMRLKQLVIGMMAPSGASMGAFAGKVRTRTLSGAP